MSEQQSSYRQIIKATSIFGGVQVFNVVIQVLRSKLVAVLLGPTGMGINGLLISALSLIGNITNCGLGISGTRHIAEAHGNDDPVQLATISQVLRKLVLVTGIIGVLVTIILSSWLSEITFGNDNYSLAFIWISISLLFNQISSGQWVIMQGMRQLKYLANANLTGSLFGLLFSLPLYYFLGIDGIVPAIIVTSIISMLRSWYFARKIKIQKVLVKRDTTFNLGYQMIKLGFLLSLSNLIISLTSYFIRIYISNNGGLDQVGLFNAGFVIIETYAGMIFTAMGTDYFPRLSAINRDNKKVRETVTQQATIAILILVPIISLFILYSPVAIQILYSRDFLAIENMINWGILGMLLKSVSWTMNFIILAKNDSKLFLSTTIFSNIVFLLNNIVGYKFWGLAGLGVSFLINQIIHFVFLLFITKHYYKFYFVKRFYKLLTTGLILCSISHANSYISMLSVKYVIGNIVIILAIVYSYRILNEMMNLNEYIYRFLNRLNNKTK